MRYSTQDEQRQMMMMHGRMRRGSRRNAHMRALQSSLQPGISVRQYQREMRSVL